MGGYRYSIGAWAISYTSHYLYKWIYHTRNFSIRCT
nr:MAG TPA: hypothetical protein [Caudoviricetes sp.]